MRILVLYDISEDRPRTKIASICEDYGLDRMQYSAFMGELTRNHQEELMMRLADTLQDSLGRIQLLPIASSEWEKRIEVGNYVG